MHFSKQFVQIAKHHGFLAKASLLLKILVHLSKVNICVNEHVSAIRMTIACVIVYR